MLIILGSRTNKYPHKCCKNKVEHHIKQPPALGFAIPWQHIIPCHTKSDLQTRIRWSVCHRGQILVCLCTFCQHCQIIIFSQFLVYHFSYPVIPTFVFLMGKFIAAFTNYVINFYICHYLGYTSYSCAIINFYFELFISRFYNSDFGGYENIKIDYFFYIFKILLILDILSLTILPFGNIFCKIVLVK